MVLQLLILALLLLVAPLLAGGIFSGAEGDAGRLPFRWVCGQFCLWAGFQLICVPLILMEESFTHVLYLFSGYGLVLVIAGAARDIVCRRKRKAEEQAAGEAVGRAGRAEGILWLIFAALLLFQLFQAVRMTYTDGDDAYYVALSTTVADSDVMYRKSPYTGYSMELDVRYGLEPFPVWIACLAKLSGMEAVLAAHLVLPAVLIAFAYASVYLLGRQLFPGRDWKLPLYMLFVGILVLFGDYSIYTAENFLIARSRQGKAALCGIVIPFVFYLIILWLKRLEKKEKLPVYLYMLLLAANMAGCLCSTLGGVLICMLAGIVGLLGAVCYRRPGQMAAMALCCLPSVCYAALQLFLN